MRTLNSFLRGHLLLPLMLKNSDEASGPITASEAVSRYVSRSAHFRVSKLLSCLRYRPLLGKRMHCELAILGVRLEIEVIDWILYGSNLLWLSQSSRGSQDIYSEDGSQHSENLEDTIYRRCSSITLETNHIYTYR